MPSAKPDKARNSDSDYRKGHRRSATAAAVAANKAADQARAAGLGEVEVKRAYANAYARADWKDPTKRKRRQKQHRAWEARNPGWRRTYSGRRYEKLKARTASAKRKPCSDCGKRWPPECMQFHHPDGNPRPRGHRSLFRLSEEAFEAEMKITVLLCANCHAYQHATGRRFSDA